MGRRLFLAGFAALALLAADSSQTAAGLSEALKVATERAVASTSRTDGFAANPKIRIPLPGKLDGMASGLRAVGMGAQVDELELSMNRAAEQAAGQATPVFVDAIKGMSFQDASGIL